MPPPQQNLLHDDDRLTGRPVCPTCTVPMWLVEVEHLPGPPYTDRLHFECKACDGKAVIPPLE
jgi:hypothetical protein